MQTLSIREQQKRDRKQRIFSTAMKLFETQGFQETTVLTIAKAAKVSRGTVFNYFPYKEAILIEHLAQELTLMQDRVKTTALNKTAIESLYEIFEELAKFVESNSSLVLPLSYELLNPDPERSRQAFISLPLVAIIYDFLTKAREQNLIRSDYSRERLARIIANHYFLTALQWANYRQDRSIKDELRTSLKLTLEGILL